MTNSTSQRVPRKTGVWTHVTSLVLWSAALVIAGISFVMASQAARDAVNGTLIPKSFLGLPIFAGFHMDDRFGVHPEWGLLVLLVVPAIVGIVTAAADLRSPSKRA